MGLLKRLIPDALRRSAIAADYIKSCCGERVRSGPFAGLVYRSGDFSKLLGTYELELHALVQHIIDSGYTTIVDVGAAEGYYAGGFALKSTETRVIAFEAEETKRQELAALLELNGVAERVSIRGLCNVDDLRACLGGESSTFVFMDVEGAEDELLDSHAIPALLSVPILVETHDFIVPDITATLRERFTASHRIAAISSRARRLADLPLQPPHVLRAFAGAAFVRSMGEERPCEMTWLLMEPKAA